MKRDAYVLVALAGLGIAFAAVSLLVHFTRGNPRLVARKLRLGALMLGLSGVAAGSGCSPTCYEPSAVDVMTLRNADGSRLRYDDPILVPATGEVLLRGVVSERQASAFSYKIVDALDPEVMKVEQHINALDHSFDEPTEDFEIRIIGATLGQGSYSLRLGSKSTSGRTNYLAEYQLEVK